MKIVYVDMDSTLNNLIDFVVEGIPSSLRKRNTDGTPIRSSRLEHHFNIPFEKAIVLIEGAFKTRGFWANLLPREGAYETLSSIKNEEGEQIDFRIASNPYYASASGTHEDSVIEMIKEEKVKWIEKHFPGIFSSYDFIKNKYNLKGDAIIDDYKWAVVNKNNPSEKFFGRWIKFLILKYDIENDGADEIITSWDQLTKPMLVLESEI